MFTRLLLLLLVAPILAQAEDWPRFRGPEGNGKATSVPPLEWSASKNLKWSTPLPGAGTSSPIVLGQKVFLTCYSGYGQSAENPGKMEELKRHVVALDRADGKIIWEKTIPAEMPEDPYEGFITEHGYASNTPVTDGERLYVFLGKSGVFAFDLAGKQLWHRPVGKESSNRRWGSAASPVLWQDLLIVNAAEESQTVYALDKLTGEEKWKSEAGSLELAYGTPTIAEREGGTSELLLAVPNELWGMNPKNGKLKWFAAHNLPGNISPSVTYAEGVCYVFGGRPGGSWAIKAGSKGEVPSSDTAWNGKNASYVATPVLHEGNLYWVDDRGVANCVNAATGESRYQQRVSTSGGFRGRPFYASPVLAGDRLYVPSRNEGVFVFAAQPEFKQLAQNKFADDPTDFNATPAIVDGQLFLRSNRAIYCVAGNSE